MPQERYVLHVKPATLGARWVGELAFDGAPSDEALHAAIREKLEGKLAHVPLNKGSLAIVTEVPAEDDWTHGATMWAFPLERPEPTVKLGRENDC